MTRGLGCRPLNVQYFGALDGKEVAFNLRLHANVRTMGCFFSVFTSICSQYHSSILYRSTQFEIMIVYPLCNCKGT